MHQLERDTSINQFSEMVTRLISTTFRNECHNKVTLDNQCNSTLYSGRQVIVRNVFK